MLVPKDPYDVLPTDRPLPDDIIDRFTPYVEDTEHAFEYHFQAAHLASYEENQVRTQLFAEGFYSVNSPHTAEWETCVRAPITGDVHLDFQEAAAILRRGLAPKGAYETEAAFCARSEQYINAFHRPINHSIRFAELRAKAINLGDRASPLWADVRRLDPDIRRGSSSDLAKAARKGRSFAMLNEVRLRRDQTRRFNPESAP